MERRSKPALPIKRTPHGAAHILFVVGLLLLGGSLGWLLKIVIALSIVFVGVNAFLGNGHRDPRLLFAFCFGLIHGFGFPNALKR